MTITISGTSGVTYPAGGVDNTAGAGVGTTDTQTLTNKTLGSGTALSSSLITSGTIVTLTNQTSVDFSVPSWVKRITMQYNGVSTNGTSFPIIQLGDNVSGVSATTYVGCTTAFATTPTISATNYSTGFLIQSAQAASVLTGSIILTLQDASTNRWIAQGVFGRSDSAITIITAGAKGFAAATTLTTVRITTVNGTDQYDAGQINIIYE